MKIINIALLTSFLLFTSCNLLNNGINRGYKAQKPEYYTENGDRVSISETSENQSEKTVVDNNENATAVSNKPVESVQKVESPVVAKDTTNYSLALNGEWIVVEVNGEKLKGDERPYFTFEAATNFYYGSNGCNTLNGTFEAGPNGKLTLGDGATTMKLCHDAPYEFKINGALAQTVGYKLSQSGSESLLKFLSSKDHTVMILKRANINYINGAWKVTKINGESDLVNDGMKFVFDVQELRLHGNTGCNIINGQMFIDPDQQNSIQFSQLLSTQMLCPDVNGETALLVALEETSYCWKVNNNTIVFKNRSGKELIRFEKLELNK